MHIVIIAALNLGVDALDREFRVQEPAAVGQHSAVELRAALAEPSALAHVEVCHRGPGVGHFVDQDVEPFVRIHATHGAVARNEGVGAGRAAAADLKGVPAQEYPETGPRIVEIVRHVLVYGI